MNKEKIKHNIFLLNEIKEIPQQNEYFRKLLIEQIDLIIYNLIKEE